MKWCWQLPDWPDFSYNASRFGSFEERFLLRAGEMRGAVRHLDPEEGDGIRIEIIREEALLSSRIEGEFLDRESIQSSLRHHFGFQTGKPTPLLREQGVSDLLVDVYRSFDEPLSHALLTRWHEKLFRGQRSDAGVYRRSDEPMQIVSGAVHDPEVHYEAVPSARVVPEMGELMDWFAKAHEEKLIPPLMLAGITHLWFEQIHPFDDGNGRIGRALAEKSLSLSLGRPALISLSTAIESKKSAYYQALAAANRANDITNWLQYFLPLVVDAQDVSLRKIEFVITKGRLLAQHSGRLNERQEKVIMRMLREGVDGFQGGLSAGNYISITPASKATVTRDLQDLVAKEVLTRTGEKRHTRYFLNFPE
ncbi:MAG: Fic family protein [Akkermansiaceae bacterium]|nr:Fic family protein [Akkermansiaceae bacterium]